MPGTTTVFGLRYQVATDSPEGDDLGKNLADDVEAALLAERATGVCELVQQTAQTGWSSGTATAVTFGASSEVVDSGTYHDTGSNTSRLVIGKKLGWWLVSGVYVPLSSTNTTSSRCWLARNGTAVSGTFSGIVHTGTVIVGIPVRATLIEVTSATDYVELIGQQNLSSGTGGTAISSPAAASALSAVWQRPSI